MTAENYSRSKNCYTSGLKAKRTCSPGLGARSLGWIRTLACGAGDPGFKSQRARQNLLSLNAAWAHFFIFWTLVCTVLSGSAVKQQKKAGGADLKCEHWVVDVRVPTEGQIAENPKRIDFIGGGWVDSTEPEVVCLYWHKRKGRFSVYSLLNVLEHETLHVVLAKRLGLQASIELDRVHRSSCVRLDDERLVFVNEFKFRKEWVLPPYSEEPTEDVLE